MPNSIAIAPRDETLGHAIVSKSLTEPMRQNDWQFWMQIIVRWWFHAFSTLLSLCVGNHGHRWFPLATEGRSGDMPLYEPAMAYFSEVVSYWLPVEIWPNQQQDSISWYDGLVQIRRQAIIWINDGNFTCNTHSCRTISWQCDRPRYDVAYVELITALNIVGYLLNSQELMAISTRLCLWHTRWICRIFFQAMDSNELLCQFVHALRGNQKFEVVRLCSELVGDSLWSSGLCMPNFRQIGQKNLWCGVKPPSI